MKKDLIVISGINLVDGGPISVYYDFLTEIINCEYYKKYKIIALVGKKELFDKYANKIEIIEFRKSKQSWILRLYYEYFYFAKMSKKMNIKIWISLHDITPNVYAEKKYVYCHNPSPFHKMSIYDAPFGIKYYLFSKFYRYLYAINIKKNDAVIVQQDWIRKKFIEMYGISNVIVARPSIQKIKSIENKIYFGDKIFIYPSLPRFFKNFQLVCEATKILNEKGINNFEVYITFNGTENNYSSWVKSKYEKYKNINFCGLLSRDDLFTMYSESNCLLFTSKLETWGIPITEYKSFGKPLIVSDLPYAHETVGNYKGVAFVNPDDANCLAEKMLEVITTGRIETNSSMKTIEEPFANNWRELCQLIFK